MVPYAASRLLLVFPTVLGVFVLVFLLVHLVPGDPAAMMLGENASDADVAALRTTLGLDRPLGVQLLDALRGAATLELGQSLHFSEPVADLLAERIGPTALLASCALVLAIACALPLGAMAALHPGRAIDHASMTAALLGISIPSFWLGPLLLWLFAVKLDLFPTGGAEDARGLVLPALTLALPMTALLARMSRASLLDEARQDYVRVAESKGLSRSRAVLRHGLRNALIPIVTIVGLQFGSLLTGAIITEQVFAWPGLGGLLIEAIASRDYPLVQGTVLLFAVIYVLVNLATDLVYAAVDPRVRLS
ncbi:MAG: ABC transporter permease [Acidobacteriota bacterium]